MPSENMNTHATGKRMLQENGYSLWPQGLLGCGKGGLSLRGVAFMTGFGGCDGFDDSGEHLALVLLVLKNTVPRGNHDGFGGYSGWWWFGL